MSTILEFYYISFQKSILNPPSAGIRIIQMNNANWQIQIHNPQAFFSRFDQIYYPESSPVASEQLGPDVYNRICSKH